MRLFLPFILSWFLILSGTAQIVNIPDANFKNALLNHVPVINTNNDGEIQVSEALAFTDTINVLNKNIANITGIEAFVNLAGLNCEQNQIPTLPITGLNNLKILRCSRNKLTSISFSNPSLITELKCSYNQLSALPTGMTGLKILHCIFNQITSLDLNSSASITYVDFSANLCTSFSLSNKNLLTDIICSSNQLFILTLSNLPALKNLLCENNQLTNLSLSNFPALYKIRCDLNQLISLTVSNMPFLGELFCNNNKLPSLSVTNFPSLSLLACGNNQLTTLVVDNLPALSSLYCHDNLLTALPLPNLPSLYNLMCFRNNITSITMNNYPSLVNLECFDNKITHITLSNLPVINSVQCQRNLIDTLTLSGLTSLKNLTCGESNTFVFLSLTNLPALEFFECNATKLAVIDLSQTSVKHIRIEAHPLLQYINLKNGAIVPTGFFEIIRNLPSLVYICADSAEIAYINTLLNAQLPGQIVTVSSLCNYTINTFNTITGTVRFDESGNGCNNFDSSMYTIKIKIDNGTQTGYTFTNNLGNYKFYVLQSTNIVSPVFEDPYFNAAPPSHTITFAGLGSTQVADFCVTANGIHPDLEITLLPVANARPGFDAQYKIVYNNKGNQVQSGTVTLNFDAVKLNFLSSIPNVSSQTPGNLTWSYAGLSPYETRTITLVMHVNVPPVVNIGDILSFTAVINQIPGDETPIDNTFNFNQVVRGAFDPNDKDVTEGSAIHISKIGDYLHYLVRFQNTGNAAATNVLIKDSLADNLNWNSLVPVDASHTYRTVITKGNKVEFIFDGINLPGKNINEPASHGFAAFKIKPKNTIAVGETIYNKAEIYFDFNLPVITNTVSTTIIDPKQSDNIIGLSSYPNPAKDYIWFTVKQGVQIKAINLYNSIGEKLYTETVVNPVTSKKINTTNLPSGILFLEVISDQGKAIQKLIRIK